MNKILLGFLLMATALITRAQPAFYPFPTDSTVWYVQYTKPGVPGFCRTDIFSVQGKELFQGFSYYKLFVDRAYNNAQFDSVGSEWLFSYRQDTARRIIYKMPFGILNYMHFNYNIQSGMSDTIYPTSPLIPSPVQLAGIDSIELLDGTYRRLLTVNGSFPSEWIDGIGNLYGWTNSPPNQEFVHYLQCVYQNGVLVYKKDAADCYCNLGVGLEEAALNELNIYPNPVSDVFYLPAQPADAEAGLFCLTGSFIKALQLNTFNKADDLPAGIYVVKVSTAQGISTTKMVKL